jgi:hypothetical protein
MTSRCENINSKAFCNYGARGISVCARWKNSFSDFFSDMGPRPSSKHSIDRIDNNGNYCPENCRWATTKEQGNNKRDNIRLTFRGVSKTLMEWSRETGIIWATLHGRHRRGWPTERILTQPVAHKKAAE